MKRLMKYMKVCAGLLLMAGTSACNHDDFLTVDYYDIIDGDMMFTSIENAESGLIGCYDMFYPNSDYCGDWGLKPQIMLGDHPTLDTQATAWDRNYCIQAWTADDNDISNGWNHAYHAISRCNTFIKGLKEADFEESDKVMMMAEARAIRAWFYMFLTQSWGRVPMLDEEDTYATAPNKPRAENEAAMWDFIIADLQYAADNLTWAPRNNEAGRVTKGMATAYLAEAYMWKAYKHSADYATYDTFATPDESVETSSYLIAEELLKSIIDSGQYELNPSFTTLWDPGAVWTKEAHGAGWVNNELQKYTEESVSTGMDGDKTVLILTAKRVGNDFYSGRINSKGKKSFQYGKVEASIKLPKTANGLWPAFWMMGDNDKQWPACGEIDIMEMGEKAGIANNTTETYINTAIHYGPNAEGHKQIFQTMNVENSLQDGNYHIYSLEWNENELIVKVDDILIKKFYIGAGSEQFEYFNYKFYFIFNLAVGGDFPGITDPALITALEDGESAQMFVDWVKIYN